MFLICLNNVKTTRPRVQKRTQGAERQGLVADGDHPDRTGTPVTLEGGDTAPEVRDGGGGQQPHPRAKEERVLQEHAGRLGKGRPTLTTGMGLVQHDE